MTCKVLTAAILSTSALLAQFGSYGDISGTVANDSKKAVPSATVVATRKALPPVRIMAQAAADGTYTLRMLPPGDYELCAMPVGDGYTGSCDWFGSPAKVTVIATKTVAAPVLTLTAGSIIPIALLDPQQLIDAKTAAGKLPHLEVGVIGGRANALYLAHRVSKTSAVSTYQVTVPRNVNVKLSIQSKDLQVTGTGGITLPSSAPFLSAFQQGAVDVPLNFQFSVVGVKK